MANDLKAKIGKMKGFALVRDENGRPKFDDVTKRIPDPIWDQLLTDKDKEYIKELRHDAFSCGSHTK